ncbi:MAG: TolC family protein [Candidatus Eremiobacteraeota bacterium]|nr:TolC family protein [Candidatus Eremiobacteraeota bacterium]
MIAALLAASLTLSDVEREAVAQAPSVSEARARVNEQQALLDAARGGGAPHAVVNYAQVPQGGATGGTILQRLTTVGAQVVLGDLAARNPLVAQASAALRSATATEAGAEVAERIKAIRLFIDAIRTREVTSLRGEIYRAAQADRNAAFVRFEAGDVARLDVVRTDVGVARAQADLATARADEINAKRNLAIEIAAPLNTLQVPTLAQAGAPPMLTVSLDSAVQRALANRPEIRSARAEVAAEEYAVRASHRSVLPALTVQAGYTAGTDSGVNVSGPSANVTLDIPVSRVANDRTHAEEARFAQAQARLASATQTVTTEVSNAFESLAAQREAVAAGATARAEAFAEIQAATVGYREGAASSLDLADARRTYAAAVVDDITARAALDESIFTFALAVGEQR